MTQGRELAAVEVLALHQNDQIGHDDQEEGELEVAAVSLALDQEDISDHYLVAEGLYIPVGLEDTFVH